MIQNVLTHIGGVEVYGIISVCLFFALFLGLMIWALRLKRPYLQAMGSLPLEPEDAASGPDSENTALPQDRHERSE